MVTCKYGGFSIKPKVETDEEYKKRVEKRIKKIEELNSIIEILLNKLSVVELDKFLEYIRVHGSDKLYDGIKEKLKNLTNDGWKNW